VGNLPYYLTGALVNQIADAWAHFDLAVVMMQKEVADRISARPLDSNRGSLSVYLQAIFDIEVVVQVPPEAFLPAPSVKSTVLQLKPRRRERPISNEVFRVIKQGFSQPRKTLSNNLVAGLGLDRETVGRAIEEARLRGDVRAHMLTEENWISVAEGLV
jgi:16S rRNA (adenine1518-N6/adenine1519-N6)-dimethyltransferase